MATINNTSPLYIRIERFFVLEKGTEPSHGIEILAQSDTVLNAQSSDRAKAERDIRQAAKASGANALIEFEVQKVVTDSGKLLYSASGIAACAARQSDKGTLTAATLINAFKESCPTQEQEYEQVAKGLRQRFWLILGGIAVIVGLVYCLYLWLVL